MISLEFYGNPIPLKRPRFCRNGSKVTTIDPQKKEKETFQWQLKTQYREKPLECPIALDLIFFMPIPKSSSKIKQRQMENGVIGHMKKPDIDNLIKFTCDYMNHLVFKDDAQISEIRAKKIYSSKPGTLIRVLPLADEKRSLLYENCARNL